MNFSEGLRITGTLAIGTTLGAACTQPDHVSPTPIARPAIVEPAKKQPTVLPTPTFVDFGPQPATPIAQKNAEEKNVQLLKERVLAFTWNEAQDPEKLNQFINILADSYLQLTKTPRLTKNDLMGEGKTTFYNNPVEFKSAVQKTEPRFQSSLDQWGYTHYASKKVFMDLGSLKSQGIQNNTHAGLKLIGALWHEWGHLDVTERTQGELLNNVSRSYFLSPTSNRNEPYRKYRGVEVYTDTYFGFARLEEVVNETITVLRLIEQVGLEEVASAGVYYRTGVDFFPGLTKNVGISLEELYNYHATSDFEGLAKRIGARLRGTSTPLDKGKDLFIATHTGDRAWITSLGIQLTTP